MTLLKHELKINFKTFLIWVISVSVLCGGCLMLFDSMKGAMEEMAQSYADMGAFTQAFGMDKLSIATMDGFFSVEVGTMFAIGAAMFSALMGIGMLSKEEGAHTAEFLNTLPIKRSNIVIQKLLSLLIIIGAFDLICYGVFCGSIAIVGEKADLLSIFIYILAQFVMHIQIALLCFAISAFTKKNQFGIGLGLAMVLYMLDIISRITDKVDFLKFFTPFYYANSSDIMSNQGIKEPMLLCIGIVISVFCAALAYMIYTKKDIAS